MTGLGTPAALLLDMNATTREQMLQNDNMPGTKANPFPAGLSADEREELRQAWAAADPMTQEQRNERYLGT